MKRPKTTGRFCVADRSFPSDRTAISYAQGLATEWGITHLGDERTFSVCDTFGKELWRVDLLKDGCIETWEVKAAA